MTLEVRDLIDEQYKSTVMEYMQGGSNKGISLFVEGDEDISFYGNIIDNRMYERGIIRFYVCKGKQRVYQVYEFLENKRIEGKRLYFVDKDLSDILEDDPTPKKERLYITELYSIENYLASTQILHRFIRDIYRLTNITVEEIEEEYYAFRERIDPIFKEIMAWIIIQRRKGYRPTLADKKIDDVMKIDQDLGIIRVGSSSSYWENFANIFPQCQAVLQSEMDLELSNLDSLSPKVWLRGKYDLWAFIEFLNKFQVYFRRLDPAKRAVPKMPAQGNTILGHLFPRCLPSDELRIFLDSNFTDLNRG